MKLPICGIVIAYNEEANIERCLKSLEFCEKVLVVDSESTDKTVEIAKKYTPHVLTKKWDGYGSQKNFANQFSEVPWILSVDADEEVSDELKKELFSLFQKEPNEKAFSIPRKTIHFGRWIRYGGWYPNRLIRCFHRDHGAWSSDELHEKWETTSPVGEIKNDLLHYSFEDFTDQVARNNYYSSLGAIDLKKQKVKFSFLKQQLKTASKFFETYFLKLGFLDGYPGFIISVSAAYSVFVKWAKLWELEENEKRLHHHH